LSVSPFEFFGFPVVVTLWIAYVWVFTAQTIRSFSVVPRSPWRVTAIIVACSVVAAVAIAASIVIGLIIVAPRAGTSP